MQSRQEWETPVPISVKRTHNGHYQLERGRSENRMIRVTYGDESKTARLGAMDPEGLARLLLSEIVGKKTSGG
jgi:hypothetical protein